MDVVIDVNADADVDVDVDVDADYILPVRGGGGGYFLRLGLVCNSLKSQSLDDYLSRHVMAGPHEFDLD